MGGSWDSAEVERARSAALRCRRMAELFSDPIVVAALRAAAAAHEADVAGSALDAWHWTDNEPD